MKAIVAIPIFFWPLLFALWGCRSTIPRWSDATSFERASGRFKADDAYFQSQQYRDDINESAATVRRLQEHVRRNSTNQ